MVMSHAVKNFSVMMDVHTHALDPSAPCADVPPGALKVTLRSHQQAMLYAMEQQERNLLMGLDCSGERLFSSFGILGDSVGVGKSLMVLGHISRLASIPPLTRMIRMGSNSSTHVFSVKEVPIVDVSEAGSLIVVPHTLFRQWADYIKKQTNLKALLLDKKKCLTMENFKRDVLAADIVLVSNTLYKDFSYWIHSEDVRWKRVFYDEADTVHLVGGYHKPITRFTWFITASWMNVLFPNETMYISYPILQSHIFNEDSQYKPLRPYFEEMYRSAKPYNYMRNYFTSMNFFREMLSTDHALRGRLVLRCQDAFIQQSISLPPLTRINVLCRAPLTQQIVNEVLPADVQQLLHGGDTAGAIAALGVKTEDTVSLIDAVTKNLQKELNRHRSTYEFKANLEYSSAKAKEEALKSLEEKIKRTESAIQSIKQRIDGFKEEMCPICYDEPSEALLTPCCSRIFCGQCILTCLTRANTCPMCREVLHAKKLTKVVAKTEQNAIVTAGEEEQGEKLEKKADALLRLFRENPKGRFLVFSRYDNPFVAMEESIEGLGLKVKQVKGNKDAVAATLRAFETGDLRCLLLNSHYAGSGLNITAATHVILYHAMTHEEEKQILGRAYRMGRTEPLTFYRLLHEGESVTASF